MMIAKVVVRNLAILLGSAVLAFAQTAQPLQLEKTMELPDVQGRIDHMSVDVKRGRLFISALGNNTVEVIDVKAGALKFLTYELAKDFQALERNC